MSFQEAIQSVFQKYICFSGRARRSEYWYFALLNWAVSAVLTAIARNFDSSLASLFLTLWNIGRDSASAGGVCTTSAAAARGTS